MRTQISRRTVLRGLGTAMALPLLESMMPIARVARAAGTSAGSSGDAPVRMAFLFAPNGKHMPDWTPNYQGTLKKLPPILEPLESFKSDIFLPSGLSLTTARTQGCGGHSCTVGQFLTGTLPKRTLGTDLRNGISVDQAAAEAIGHHTRFPSLELGCIPSKYSGDCDSGFSCVYTTHISWRTETSPLPKSVNPRAVFDRLFGNRIKDEEGKSGFKRDQRKQSILDFVGEEGRALRRRLGINDRRKLDEYLYAVREIERRLARVEASGEGVESGFDALRPAGIPGDSDEHLRLMMDMMVLAFQTDSTRTISFMIGNGSDNRPYPQIGIAEGHHNLSHHVGDKKKHVKISRINRHFVTNLAYFLKKLKSIKEGDGTLLDNSMILYGCAFGDGNDHDPTDLPILVAGNAGGTIRTGRHVRYEKGTPLTNLYLSMLDRVGAPTEKLGDSTGRLDLVG
ncbi:MAG: DUF1552 domain-containing protein [Planctomycetes bacterium]|nr:DUF1552 domain-containing protein [Planctomycetota bacterium]